MAKSTRKHKRNSATREMDFDEALGRFTQTGTEEAQKAVEATNDERVRLIEREEAAHPLLIYPTAQGVKVELPWREGTLWASQDQMADMFGVNISSISRHLKNIFDEGELAPEATVSKIERVALEGERQVRRQIETYNLNAIISVGYRVGSKQGTMFRIWSTDKLVQILTKGFYIDKERLKQPDAQSRIDEIKGILQDIRSEQATVHRELEQICAQCQDYAPGDPNWQKFFRDTSAAIFYAAVQHTPSEIILGRADADHETMGLVTWPKDNIRKADVTVGKNFLGQTELDDLNRFSSLLLDFILDQARSGRMVTMEQARRQIEEITTLSGRKVLRRGGGVSRKAADAHAHAQYAKFDARRKADRQLRGDRAFDEDDGS
jgi:hypothetical protein